MTDFLMRRPIFGSNAFIEATNAPRATASRLIRQLVNAGVLTAIREKSGRRGAVYAFTELITLIEGR
jgi:DNA-binding IclR family transcriptional regulator